jgi:hypothetical protein
VRVEEDASFFQQMGQKQLGFQTWAVRHRAQL